MYRSNRGYSNGSKRISGSRQLRQYAVPHPPVSDKDALEYVGKYSDEIIVRVGPDGNLDVRALSAMCGPGFDADAFNENFRRHGYDLGWAADKLNGMGYPASPYYGRPSNGPAGYETCGLFVGNIENEGLRISSATPEENRASVLDDLRGFSRIYNGWTNGRGYDYYITDDDSGYDYGSDDLIYVDSPDQMVGTVVFPSGTYADRDEMLEDDRNFREMFGYTPLEKERRERYDNGIRRSANRRGHRWGCARTSSPTTTS